ncbi:hypothetical protein D9N00_17880 [Pseudomonas syringae pv. actinidiae]|nr:hypothetical protein D9N00_17880 [Pseudomonas syringae pv. actinidiae]AYL84191.1 hypothetical protein CN228_19955 [Pseudomonas syringae pv. actinidiae str. Shaanxi_M228]
MCVVKVGRRAPRTACPRPWARYYSCGRCSLRNESSRIFTIDLTSEPNILFRNKPLSAIIALPHQLWKGD